jgi:hypothetical protein
MHRLSLKNLLFLCFCAVLLIVTKAAFRWHLGISGHAMFFTVFFLLLARVCVPLRAAALATGLIAGMAAMALGMGKGGPLILLKFLLPAAAIDLAALALPGMWRSFLLCAGVGALAGSTKFVGTAVLNLLIGMDRTIVWQHALLQALGATLFGAVGALCLPPVVRRLQAYGIIHPENRRQKS